MKALSENDRGEQRGRESLARNFLAGESGGGLENVREENTARDNHLLIETILNQLLQSLRSAVNQNVRRMEKVTANLRGKTTERDLSLLLISNVNREGKTYQIEDSGGH